MAFKSYRGLRAWQEAMDLVARIYALTKAFPKDETYGLISQVGRAAVSVPSNIAEGHARDSTREFLHHLSISLGSLAELETQMIAACRLDHMAPEVLHGLLDATDGVGTMIRGLQKSLKRKVDPP